MKFETNAEYADRIVRCHALAASLTQGEAMAIAADLGRIPIGQMTTGERDRFVAANIAIREG